MDNKKTQSHNNHVLPNPQDHSNFEPCRLRWFTQTDQRNQYYHETLRPGGGVSPAWARTGRWSSRTRAAGARPRPRRRATAGTRRRRPPRPAAAASARRRRPRAAWSPWAAPAAGATTAPRRPRPPPGPGPPDPPPAWPWPPRRRQRRARSGTPTTATTRCAARRSWWAAGHRSLRPPTEEIGASGWRNKGGWGRRGREQASVSKEGGRGRGKKWRRNGPENWKSGFLDVRLSLA